MMRGLRLRPTGGSVLHDGVHSLSDLAFFSISLMR